MIVVTGLKRTGTSTEMQIVECLGFPAHHLPWSDQYNPNGYYECEESQAGIDTANFPDTVAAKVFIDALVKRSKIKDTDKIIVCIRHPDSAINSPMQEMTEALYIKEMRMVKAFVESRPKNTLVIDYDLMLFRPLEEISSISVFLGLPYCEKETEKKIAAAVKIIKQREKISLYHWMFLQTPGPVFG